jgi:NAD(P)-dependent dehydrogenase (short-subunit alcohol dehydrogenase family)
VSIELGYAGKACVVTGGTRGIGKAVVALLLDQGAHVLAVGSRTETADALRAEIDHDNLRVIAQDMRADDCGTNVVAAAVDAFGGIDLLVNNAAAFDYVPPDTLRRSDWTGLFTLKALGYWSLATAAIPELVQRRGAIVNVSGVAGVVASPGSPHVGATNAAVISMTEGMALKLAPEGVRVNVVSPGAVDTDRFATRASLRAEDQGIDVASAREQLSSDIPVGGPADPAEVALVIALLGAPVTRSVTGAHVVVDGAGTLGGRRRT